MTWVYPQDAHMHTGRMLHVGRVIPQDAHMPAGRMPHVGRHIPQDAHISTGRTHARRMHTYLQDAHMPAGCTHAHKTHTRGVPTMDGELICLHMFRVKATWVLPAGLASGRDRGAICPDSFTRAGSRRFCAKHVQIRRELAWLGWPCMSIQPRPATRPAGQSDVGVREICANKSIPRP